LKGLFGLGDDDNTCKCPPPDSLGDRFPHHGDFGVDPKVPYELSHNDKWFLKGLKISILPAEGREEEGKDGT
jgi:hypothetical protein